MTLTMYPTKHKIKSTTKSEDKICLCKTLSPVFTLCRYAGMLPISWKHVDGTCHYKISMIWMAYNIVIICFCIIQLVTSVDFANLTSVKSLPIMMNDICKAIYGIYVVILLSLCFYRSFSWARTLNKLHKTLRHNIFCQSSMTQCLLVQRTVLAAILVMFSIAGSTMICLQYSRSYKTNFNYKVVINNLIMHVSFIFYGLFLGILGAFLGILACFEKLTISCLHYRPVHPMKGIDETNNKGDILGLISYELCKGKHPLTDYINKLPPAEIVEFLRIMHEEISVVMYETNQCMNPQFLVHTIVELTVLIVNWYSFIVYLAYEFKDPLTATVHVMNCVFCFPHTLGLFFFLRHAQHLKNMVHGLTSFLLEYSTRISSVEEHQQVRMFIEKIKQHRPFTASGVFNIDLGIAGPISANILTYVLVALQFDIPKE